MLALAGEFEAVNAAWKGWRIHKGKLHAPDLADGFTTGQIRALPFLHGALDVYRRQAAHDRPDTSTVHDWKTLAARQGSRGRETPEPCQQLIEPLRDQGTPTVLRVEATRRAGQDPALTRSALPQPLTEPHGDRAAKSHLGSPRAIPIQAEKLPEEREVDVNVTSLCHQLKPLQFNHFRKSRKKSLSLLRYIDKPQGRGAPDRGPEEEKTSPPTGATALPVSLPVSGSGRKRPAKKPQKHSQGRIIDIMLNNMFLPISQSSIDPPIFSSQEELQHASRVDTL